MPINARFGGVGMLDAITQPDASTVATPGTCWGRIASDELVAALQAGAWTDLPYYPEPLGGLSCAAFQPLVT